MATNYKTVQFKHVFPQKNSCPESFVISICHPFQTPTCDPLTFRTKESWVQIGLLYLVKLHIITMPMEKYIFPRSDIIIICGVQVQHQNQPFPDLRIKHEIQHFTFPNQRRGRTCADLHRASDISHHLQSIPTYYVQMSQRYADGIFHEVEHLKKERQERKCEGIRAMLCFTRSLWKSAWPPLR